MAIPRLKQYDGPAILSYGFRPFFFLGAIYSGLAVLLWIPLFYGWLDLQTAFDPVDWHIHEMLYGFLPAIVTGFLLTAVPNWTGRLPVQGKRLGFLVALWVIGRIAVLFSATIGAIPAAALDCLFLFAVTLAVANEIIAGKNWRNLKVLLPLGILLAGNVLFHAEAYLEGTSDYARRIGVAAAVILIMLIGGRIIPSFTRNWLAREKPGRLPVPFNRFDLTTIASSVIALALWITAPDWNGTAIAMSFAGIMHFARMARWAGERTGREPLVFILHVAYLFVPAGFILSGLAVLLPDVVLPQAGLHAFGAGAIGAMTLAVMMRATLGHTGHALRMSKGAHAVFVLALAAALLRLLAAFDMGASGHLIALSGVAWSAAFLGFAAVFGGKLLKPRWRPDA
jgi:uncharacterized protein involved in response to NO